MSPHTFEPLPQQMSRLSRAAVFFMIGIPFEQALIQRLAAVCPDLKFVDTGKNVARRSMNEQESDHQHSEDCVHEVGTPDPHIWLDPAHAVTIAAAIASGLIEIMPDKAARLEEGLQKLTAELTAVDEELAASLKPLKGQTILVFHPAFGYFAARYGLKQQSVEIEGKEPGPRQLAELIRQCRQLGIRVVFVQKQFPVAAAETIARSINGAVVSIDPLAEDYIANLNRLGEAMMEAVRAKLAQERHLEHLETIFQAAWEEGLELPLSQDRQQSLRDLFEMNLERLRTQFLSQVAGRLAQVEDFATLDNLWSEVRPSLAAQRRWLGKDFDLQLAARFDQRAQELRSQASAAV